MPFHIVGTDKRVGGDTLAGACGVGRGGSQGRGSPEDQQSRSACADLPTVRGAGRHERGHS